MYNIFEDSACGLARRCQRYLYLKESSIMKTRIYFIRHGQSYGNLHRLFLGHTDADLTDLGRTQAERTAQRLADVDFAAIYSSDLMRASNTALPNALMRDMPVIPDKRLRELYCGRWEGMTVEQIIEQYGDMYTHSWAKEFGTFVMPEGEGVQQGADRMYEATLEFARAHEGGNILCASHAAVIRALFARVMGIEPIDVAERLPYPSNASYSILEYDGECLSVASFSEDEHLAELLTTWKD